MSNWRRRATRVLINLDILPLSSLPGGTPIPESATVEPVVENAAEELDWRVLEDLVYNIAIDSVIVDNPISNLGNPMGDNMLDNIFLENVENGFLIDAVDTGENGENILAARNQEPVGINGKVEAVEGLESTRDIQSERDGVLSVILSEQNEAAEVSSRLSRYERNYFAGLCKQALNVHEFSSIVQSFDVNRSIVDVPGSFRALVYHQNIASIQNSVEKKLHKKVICFLLK